MKKAKITAKQAAKEAFIPVLLELARTYQAFTRSSDAHVRSLGLTSPQFDVISTLGNTPGMPLNKLAEQTLITKGTLTGILDRLERKGLLRREVPPDNRRSFLAVLTPRGERVFEEVFPEHVTHLKQFFGKLSQNELEQTIVALRRLREIF